MKKKKSGKVSMEKTMADFSRLLESWSFKSQAELKKFMKSIMDSGDIPGSSPLNVMQVAQDIIYAAEWLYTRVLVSFIKTGASKKTEKTLAAALEMNSHVPEYLTGEKPIPRFLPDAITWGGEDEAFCYAATSRELWKRIPGAIDWLKETTFPIRRSGN